MNTFLLRSIAFFILTSTVFISCEEDDPNESVAKGEIALASVITSPDGMSGTTYLQLIEDLTPATYDNSVAFPFTMSDQFVMRGEDIFILPFAESNLIRKYTRNADKELQETGQLSLDDNSAATAIVLQSSTKAYVSIMGRAKILIINPSTMTKTGEIDISAYAVGDGCPDPSQMVIRDGKLYVALNQMVGGYYAATDRAKSDVLIINTATDEVEKMITEETTGMSQATRPIDCKQIFVDENNDIYLITMGAFGAQPGHKAGILRINSGETVFDDSYNFVLNDAAIEGESNFSNMFCFVQYAGGGKLYATLIIPAYWGNPVSYLEDRVCIAAEIDLYTKTIKKLGLPRSNSYNSVGIYNNKIMFGLTTDNDNGFYTYDITTGEASSSAIIKTTGMPMAFRHFGEMY